MEDINKVDKIMAWEMFVALSTRITTQRLDDTHGDDINALSSVYDMFAISRRLLRKYGRTAYKATPMIYKTLSVMRQLTAKWDGKLNRNQINPKFRNDLRTMQDELLPEAFEYLAISPNGDDLKIRYWYNEKWGGIENPLVKTN